MVVLYKLHILGVGISFLIPMEEKWYVVVSILREKSQKNMDK